MSQQKTSLTLKKITISAVFLAFGVVLSILTSFDIPVLGESGIKVGISGIFTSFPALLFGPVYGGAVSALADLFRALLKPSGAFNPIFTITAFVGGFLRGLIWLIIKNRKIISVKYIGIATAAGIGAFGFINKMLLSSDGITAEFFATHDATALDLSKFSYIGKLVLSRAAITKNPTANLSTYITYTTTALILIACLMLVVFIVDFVVTKVSKNEIYRNVGFKISVTMVLSGLVQTTINTVILRQMIYPSWQQLSFYVVLVPRAIEEIVVRVIQTWFIVLLYDLYLKQIKPKFFPEQQ